jgi:mono/diheme cytochrome c family protein
MRLDCGRFRLRIRLTLPTCLLLAANAAMGADNGAAVALLQEKCLTCHGDAAMSGLRLTSRENALKGGTRGPAIVPGKSTESLLYKAVSGSGEVLRMPPVGGGLSSAEIAAIKEWLDSGAPWTSTAPATTSQWWAFKKPERPAVPPGAANPIDAFIDRKLKAAGLAPSPEADRLTLLRRASYDLLGLPPAKEQIDEFLADKSPNAWEKVVDKLLASPRYGEKWGRHWLDLARYGDTAGFEQDPYLLIAWRYRDYVIKSFNDDKPYDRFTKEQIAGDELYPTDADSRQGTGFYRVGTNRDMLFKVEDVNLVEKRIDMVDTTGSVFLGLTVGCARCHDHKFDPIPQKDYYRMQAIFQPAVNDRVFLDYNPARNYDISENSRSFRLYQIGEESARINAKYSSQLKEKKMAALPADVVAALNTPEDKRTLDQARIVLDNIGKTAVSQREIAEVMSKEDKDRLDSIAQRLLQMYNGYGPPPMAPGIIDVGREAPKTFIAVRGNPEAFGDEVQPGFLSALGGGDIPEPPLHAQTTYRRKALAEWIASPDNPLFARVMVNRIWQFHFGSGLVKTPSDFGSRAGLPANPELLDWLATEFAAKGWSMKAMHRLIMTSAAYRRESNPNEGARARDPANDLLSHFNRRRLEAEEIRDASLEVTGELNLKMGGVPAVPPLTREEMFGMIGNPASNWSVSPDPKEYVRRTIYTLQRRTFQQPMAQAFDGPDGVQPCPRRNESTTAPQSLSLLNSGFTMDRAKTLAATISGPADAWTRIYGRPPSQEELNEAQKFVDRQITLTGSKPAALAELVRGLLNTNEFLYVD